MRTPYGQRCPYYYVDSRRWHDGPAECRLLAVPDAARWMPELCRDCPAPGIKRANACPQMTLHARIGRRPRRFWEKPRMLISATCSRSGGKVEDPYVGCGLCHPPLELEVKS